MSNDELFGHGRPDVDDSDCPDKNDLCKRDPDSGEISLCSFHYGMEMLENDNINWKEES